MFHAMLCCTLPQCDGNRSVPVTASSCDWCWICYVVRYQSAMGTEVSQLLRLWCVIGVGYGFNVGLDVCLVWCLRML